MVTMLSEYFSRDELKCKCGCNKIGGFPDMLNRVIICLEKLTELAGRKPVITSAYRCIKHNAAVKGKIRSYHLVDMACDLYIGGMTNKKISNLARQAGFTGTIRYAKMGFVHCDLGPKYDRDEP